jgi:hypothetical protein
MVQASSECPSVSAQPRALSGAERAAIITVLHSDRFVDLHRPRCRRTPRESAVLAEKLISDTATEQGIGRDQLTCTPTGARR